MRIGIDARELAGRPTGVGRYLSGLLTQWSSSEQARRHEFVLYSSKPLLITLDTRRFPIRMVGGATGIWWEQVRLPKITAADHLDVFFAPGYTAPLLQKTPLVVAIHDLSFAAHPEWFSTREGARRRWFSRQAALRARAVVTISQFSKGELIERFGIPPAQIHVIPPGINSLGGASAEHETQAEHSTRTAHAAGANVLYVGSIFNRRRIPDLIQAFGSVARRHAGAGLDLVGDNRTYPRQDLDRAIAAEGLDGRVRWRRYIGDAELRQLYGSARAFAFLSEYEGLGLTPLEALAFGVPPVLADTPVARESCGDAALYVKVGDTRATAAALEQLLFDEGVRASLLSRAPAIVSKYDGAVAARDTLRVIESAP